MAVAIQNQKYELREGCSRWAAIVISEYGQGIDDRMGQESKDEAHPQPVLAAP